MFIRKFQFVLFLILAILPLSFSNQLDETKFWSSLSKKMFRECWKKNGGKPKNVIAMSNCSYVKYGDHSPQIMLDYVARETGCTTGAGNLLEVHSSRSAPAWFVFFDRNSGKAVYCSLKSDKIFDLLKSGTAVISKNGADDLFSKIESENIKADHLFANPALWDEKLKVKVFEGNEFRIVTIINAADKGVPADLLKAVLYHDHFCPGVTSGYLLANFLEKELPLRSSADSYYVISTPVWCKEDALQTVLNITPGKSGMAILPLDAGSKGRLKDQAKNLAGIFFRNDSQAKKSEAMILSFDFSIVDKEAGFAGRTMPDWEKKLKSVLWTLDNLDKTDLFIKVIGRIELNEGQSPIDFVQPGVDVLEKMNLTK